VAAHLMPTGGAHGLVLALPEQVSGHWRPRQVPGTGTPTLVRIPIVGRTEWLAQNVSVAPSKRVSGSTTRYSGSPRAISPRKKTVVDNVADTAGATLTT
jgi:hypothetical protein